DDGGPLGLHRGSDRALAKRAVRQRGERKAHPPFCQSLRVVGEALPARSPRREVLVETADGQAEAGGEGRGLGRGVLRERLIPDHSCREDEPTARGWGGDERRDGASGRRARENGATKIDRLDQLADVLDVPVEVIAGGWLVAEAMAAQVDPDETMRRREPLGQGAEAVGHLRRAVYGQNGRLATGPVHDVQGHLLQRDEILPRQGGAARGPALEAHGNGGARLGRQLATDDSLIALVRRPGSLALAARLVGLDEQDVGILAVRIDGDQARERLDGLALA